MNSCNNTSTILIRADASTEIGTGHLMRCIALGQACRDQGVGVYFACAECPPALQQRIQSEGFRHHKIQAKAGTQEDCNTLLEHSHKLAGCQWIVLDGYQFDVTFHRQIREAGFKLLVVDDYGHLEQYAADILLNQNISASQNMYPKINSDCLLLLGTRYVLLRKEFLAWMDWQRKIPEKAQNILIMMGGSDPDGTTLRVMELLQEVDDTHLHVRIVVGAANTQAEVIANKAQSLPMKSELVSNVRDMPRLLAWVDIAVSAAGSTCWELLFMAVPSFILKLAENQQVTFEYLTDTGMMLRLPLPPEAPSQEGAAAVQQLAKSQEVRSALAEGGRAMVDGLGSLRVTDALFPPQVTIRPAVEADSKRIWEWANDPVSRTMSFESRPIPWNNHQSWFRQKLNASLSICLVAEINDVPAAFVRLDEKDQDRVVSINLSPHFRGRSLASPILREAMGVFRHWCPAGAFHAFIRPNNLASIRTFEKGGFRKTDSANMKGQEALKYEYLAPNDSEQ